MAFDVGKILGGATIYGLAVMLPTIGLLLADFGHENHAAERVLVGALGILGAKLFVQGVRGEAAPKIYNMYMGITPIPLVAGIAVFYLAWFTNLPHALAGNLEGSIIVSSGDSYVDLSQFWPRIITSIISAVGAWLVWRGLHTQRSPEQRRELRKQRRVEKRGRAEKYMDYEEDYA